MSNDQIDVRYVANLARLDLTEEEADTFQSQLESVMKYVESLSAVELPSDLDIDDNSQLAILRDDIPHNSLPPELMLILIKCLS